MFKVGVIILLAIIALSMIDISNNQSLSEADKHQIYLQKQEQKKADEQKQLAEEKLKAEKELSNQKKMAEIHNKEYSSLDNSGDRSMWIASHYGTTLNVIIALVFTIGIALSIFQKVRKHY